MKSSFSLDQQQSISNVNHSMLMMKSSFLPPIKFLNNFIKEEKKFYQVLGLFYHIIMKYSIK